MYLFKKHQKQQFKDKAISQTTITVELTICYTTPSVIKTNFLLFFCLIQEKRYEKKSDMKKVVITRNVDSALQEVLDLTIRDHILSWYSDLSKDQEAFLSSLR